ncbi:FxLYD domain-containing protein [Haloarcula laminariae]|uniref:FxLYD domain-containing protein n=1 Tax=Haloarcula laminariae TaxID=2961577 RepID=UPI002406BFD8|nr:FxLYD domain-containing protein [Halomicroarcula sp. FL173]
MNRRRYLQTAASLAAIGLAGCGGSVGEDGAHTPTPTAPTPTIQHDSTRIVSDGDDRPWVRAAFSNTGDAPHGRLEVRYTVQDATGNVVSTQSSLVDYIPAGKTWLDYQIVTGGQRSRAETVDVTVLADGGGVESERIDGIIVTSSTLSKDYQSETEIVGELDIDRAYESLYLVGSLLTDSGQLRGTVGTILRDVEIGSRSFDARIADHRTPKNRSGALPTDHDIRLFEDIP